MGVIFCNDTVQFYLNLINNTTSFYMEKKPKNSGKKNNNKASIIHDCQNQETHLVWCAVIRGLLGWSKSCE